MTAGEGKGRPRGASPTARTLAYYKRWGLVAGVVERRNPRAFITHDFLGFIDVIALVDDCIVGVQVTTSSNVAARLDKIRAEPRHAAWLEAGGRIEIHGWRKLGDAGTRKLWALRIVHVLTQGEVEREAELSPPRRKRAKKEKRGATVT